MKSLPLKQADECFIVSEILAAYMSEKYEHKFNALPNCEPLHSFIAPEKRLPKDANQPCIFVFQGGLARTRGLHLLIQAWLQIKSDALLIIRGPDADPEYVAGLKKLSGNFLGTRIIFAAPVTEDELVATAAEADVGIISYEPIGMNGFGCCPNKLSQYLAAGLPVLSNELPFVRQVIENGNCGAVADFNNVQQWVTTIDSLANDRALVRQLSANAHQHFLSEFHWEKYSQYFYESLDNLATQLAAETNVGFHYEEASENVRTTYQSLKVRYQLEEIFPVQCAGTLGLGGAGNLIALKTYSAGVFQEKENAEQFASTFIMPRVLDVTHCFFSFAKDSVPTTFSVTAYNTYDMCGYAEIVNNEREEVMVALAGNPTAQIVVRLLAQEKGAVPPQIINYRFYSSGIVRDFDMDYVNVLSMARGECKVQAGETPVSHSK